MLHVIFTEDGIPGHISDDPRPGSEPVEGLDIPFLATHRRTADGEWVLRDTVVVFPPAWQEPQAEDFSLTRFQLRMGLLTFFGITANEVAALISAIPDILQRELARISWEDAQEYRFTHPLIGQISAALQLDPARVRAAWIKSAAEDWTPL
jgi:hypothetical protein